MILRAFTHLYHRILKQRQKPLRERYPQYSIGEGTYGDLKVVTLGSKAALNIGSYTSIAAGVHVYLGGEHRTDWVTTYPFSVLWDCARGIPGHPKTKGDVSIGNDVWIGTEALILSGVKIGDGAVVGARSVVSQHVPPYAIVAGNPAKLIRFRFDDSTIERLLRLRWWEWDDVQLRAAVPDLLQRDVQHFLDRAERGDYGKC